MKAGIRQGGGIPAKEAEPTRPKTTEEAPATRDGLEGNIGQGYNGSVILIALDSLNGLAGYNAAQGGLAIGDSNCGG